MPKSKSYTLVSDLAYFATLARISETLEKRGIDYLLVGGTAVQTHILSIMSNDGQIPLEELSFPDNFVGSYIRRTEDYDLISLDSGKREFLESIDDVCEGTYGNSKTHAFSAETIREGAKRTWLSVDEIVVGEEGSEKYDIKVTMAYSPDSFIKKERKLPDGFYEKRFEEKHRREIRLRYHGIDINVSVARMEHILSMKLTRKRDEIIDKDYQDITTLLNVAAVYGTEIDIDEISKNISGAYPENFMTFVDIYRDINANRS